jgi:hypothetical protein
MVNLSYPILSLTLIFDTSEVRDAYPLILYMVSDINHIPFQLSLVLRLRLRIPLRLHLFISLHLSSQI